MTSNRSIREALLLYGLDDMLHLGWIVRTVHGLTGIPRDAPEIVPPTLKVIHDLLEADYAFVGNAVQDERGYASVEPWNLPPDVAVARITQGWRERDGEDRELFVWMELTKKGRKEAERLDEEGCDPWKGIRKEN